MDTNYRIQNKKRVTKFRVAKNKKELPKTLAKLSNIHERKIRESLEINNLETKSEYDESIKVLNIDRGNIVNTYSWKPLFRKINMVRHANAIK